MKFEGRTVVVTGAGSGIGAALAEAAVVRKAAAVVVVDIDSFAANATAQRISEYRVPVVPFACDISDVTAVARLADEVERTLGTPGLVCANAGVNTPSAPLLDAKPEDLNWALSVNVTGTWATLRAFGRRMVAAAAPGWLLVTASEHAIGIPFPGNGFYTATKHAVLGLADVLRREMPPHVGVSTMIPGLVSTGLWRSGAQRPRELGGPIPENELARALLAHGMDAAAVAGMAFDGVEAERFLIATHVNARQYFDARATDVDEAFTALRSSERDNRSYDVLEIVAELTAAHAGETQKNP
ncbi:SDR family NAD(P)-dependent oxidoreductase [Nocardia sp. NPDC049737]|uniref:SDR family NAD(P)-dependent oxidoreductase n=1 Tax=Nocardia sp. NPDC049737 TaxID=3154358 RepID=UPI00343FEE6F